METPLCEQVRHSIHTAIRQRNLGIPPPALVDQIVGCDVCRGAIALLSAAVLPDLPAPPRTSCDACQADLAAFIDLEMQGYIVEAAQIYPHVWWHLWVCPSCAEEYQMLRLLSDAMQASPPVPVMLGPVATRQPIRPIGTIKLERSFLHSALASQVPAIGQARGKGSRAMVLAEEEHDGYQINLRVRQQANADWCVLVSVIPPVTGWLVVTLGELVFRTRFDNNNQSQVPDLPYALLVGVDGPDLVVRIEHDSETANGAAGDGHS